MRDKNDMWPTLEGRLSQPPVTELEALEQLQESLPLSEYGKKRLAKLRKKKNLDPNSK